MFTIGSAVTQPPAGTAVFGAAPVAPAAAPAPGAAPLASVAAAKVPTGLVGGTPLPTSAPTAAAPAANPPLSASADFRAELQRAFDCREVSPALTAAVKTRFSAPFAAPQPIASVPAQVTTLGAAIAPASMGLGSTAAPVTGLAGFLPNAKPTENSSSSGSGSSTGTGSRAGAQAQARNMADLLAVLLFCDSGYNNAHQNEISSEKNDGRRELIRGLHAAVASVAGSAASGIVAHLKKGLSPAALNYDGVLSALKAAPRDTYSTGSSRAASTAATLHVGSNSILAGAQCLYLLTLHFQMQPSFVKEALELLDSILSHVQIELSGRSLPHCNSFRDSPDTAALCTLTWLVTFSVVNAMAVWKKVRATTGDAELSPNALIRSDAVVTLGDAVVAMRKRFEDVVLRTADVGSQDGTLSFLSGSARNALSGVAAATSAATALLRSGAEHVAAKYRWLAVIEGFLSVLTLVEGCVLCARKDERGYDRALEAFLGSRSNPLSVALGGRVTERIVQLAPLPSTLIIPTDYIHVVPYEILSYLVDDMLPLVRHLASLEVESNTAFLESSQRLEEVMAFRRESGATVGGEGVDAYDAATGGVASSGYAVAQNGMLLFEGGAGHGGAAPYRGLNRAMNGELTGGDGLGAADGVAGRVDGGQALSFAPFTSEIASMLECIAVCLHNLSSSVLDPDMDADCAITFFIFRNCVKHMAQVFSIQRSSSSLWEPFTLNLVSKFLDVLAAIGRSPQYTERVVKLLLSAQDECEEMQWGSLVNQALECAGFTGKHRGEEAAQRRTVEETPDYFSTSRARATDTGSGATPWQRSAHARGANGASVHYQYSLDFARHCQQQYIASFFMFLRQILEHAGMREVAERHVSLELVLSFVFAPWQSQSMLGSTLALISARVRTPAEARTVLHFLRVHRLLSPPEASFSSPVSAGQWQTGTATAADDADVACDENRSILGHCTFEGTQGTYSITIGFLNLMTSLFRRSAPSFADYHEFSTAAKFIAQEILIGVSRRTFVNGNERDTVTALAAAALRHALAVKFSLDDDDAAEDSKQWSVLPPSSPVHQHSGPTFIPFATVLAPNKSPSDVIGEALRVVEKSSTAPYELTTHQKAATRQCLLLLAAAIDTAKHQGVELFSVDSRTVQNASVAYQALFLCGAGDPLLTQAVLVLLLHFPRPTLAQATVNWQAERDKLRSITTLFAELLHPDTVTAGSNLVLASPELAILDLEDGFSLAGRSIDARTAISGSRSAPVSMDWAMENRSLLLDLLLAHAVEADLSFTPWLCGLFDALATAAPPHSSTAGQAPPAWGAAVNGCMGDTPILDSIVTASTSASFEQRAPGLAVKCVKLLYLLRCNRLYGPAVVRGYLITAGQELFLTLQRFRADQCAPVLLSKYAYVLRLLTLEAVYLYSVSPEQLDVRRAVLPSVPAEVLVSLLHPSRQLQDVGLSSGEFDGSWQANSAAHGSMSPSQLTLPRGLAVDLTQWLRQCFATVSPFPNCDPPGGRERYLTQAASDGVLQFNVCALYEAFQLAQTSQQLPPLSVEEMRAKLTPFIGCNQCFLEYTSLVQFVEAWCQLLDVSCSIVRGVASSRLREFVLCLLDAMDGTVSLTSAAQERIAFHLFSSVSTVTTQLERRIAEEGSENATASVDAGAAGGTREQPAAASVAGTTQTANAHAAVSFMPSLIDNRNRSATDIVSSPRPPASRRRARENDGAVVEANRSVFATAAGDRSNLLSLAGRMRLARGVGVLGSSSIGFIDSGFTHSALAYADSTTDASDVTFRGPAANQLLFRRLLKALVVWGVRIPVVRADLYVSLLCLAQIPSVSTDDLLVFRCQDALFDLLAADVSGTPPAIGTAGSPAPRSVDACTGALTATRQNALELLLQMLLGSPTLCNVFCGTSSGMDVAVSARPLLCAKALLRDVDAAVSAFLAAPAPSVGGSSAGFSGFGPVMWLLRATFGFLSALSLRCTTQLLQGNTVAVCMAMECWSRCSQVLYGQGSVAAARQRGEASHAGSVLPVSAAKNEQSREVLKMLLTGALRWFNVMLAAVGDVPQLVGYLQDFVRLRRQLLEYAVESAMRFSSPTLGPAAAAAAAAAARSAGAVLPHTQTIGGTTSAIGASLSMGPPPGTVNTLTLTLLAELSSLFRGLSATPLVEACRSLAHEMAVPDLLVVVSGADFAHNCRDHVRDEYGEYEAAGAGTWGTESRAMSSTHSVTLGSYGDRDAGGLVAAAGSVPLTASPAGERNLELVALTTRNLAHFLLRSEYGLRCSADDPDSADAVTQYSRVRSDPQAVMAVLTATAQVAASLELASRTGNSSSASAGVSELRVEANLFSLHALVCLVHSFVLPLSPGTSQDHPAAPHKKYLQSLPLHRIVELFRQCRDALYSLAYLNTDYRTGLVSTRTTDGRLAISAAASISNTIADTRNSRARGPETDSAAAALGSLSWEAATDGSVTAPSTPMAPALGAGARAPKGPPSVHATDNATAPTTPLFSSGAGAASSSARPLADGKHAAAHPTRGAEMDDGHPARLPSDSLLALNTSNGAVPQSSRQHHDAAGRMVDNARSLTHARSANATTVVAGAVNERATVGSLMLNASRRDGDVVPQEWSIINSSSAAGTSLESILSTENTLRQAKIAVANALRSAETALKAVATP